MTSRFFSLILGACFLLLHSLKALLPLTSAKFSESFYLVYHCISAGNLALRFKLSSVDHCSRDLGIFHTSKAKKEWKSWKQGLSYLN